MQLYITIVRILIFSFSLGCLSIDGEILSLLNAISVIPGSFLFFVFKDLVSLGIGGFYIITLEKKWNVPPVQLDYILCGADGFLWLIYVILHIRNLTMSNAASVYGILLMFLYCGYGAMLYQLHQLKQSGENSNALPLNRIKIDDTKNDSGDGTNNSGDGNNSEFITNNSGVGMNNSGFGTNDSGVMYNNTEVGMNDTMYNTRTNNAVYNNGMNNTAYNSNTKVNSEYYEYYYK